MSEGEVMLEEITGETDLPEDGEGVLGYWKLVVLAVLIVIVLLIAAGLLKYWMVGYYGSG